MRSLVHFFAFLADLPFFSPFLDPFLAGLFLAAFLGVLALAASFTGAAFLADFLIFFEEEAFLEAFFCFLAGDALAIEMIKMMILIKLCAHLLYCPLSDKN